VAENENGMDKTEEATPRRREDARKKGQVARSRELNTFASLLGAGVALLMLGPLLLQGLQELLVQGLRFDYERAYDSFAMTTQLSGSMRRALVLLLPMILVMAVLSLLSPLALGGFLFSVDQLQPKYERIDPLKGLKRIFSVKSLLELVKAVAKFLLVTLMVAFVLRLVLADIIALPLQEAAPAMQQAARILLYCFLAFSTVLLLVVAIDVPWQLWDFSRQLMMTKQEVREEMKETEGKPELKQAIRARQQEVASRRMMEKVPGADVVITNPTHYAVAIKYDQNGSGAPRVVAKGKDHVAARIRELAKENGVALFAAPPLARALYASTALDQEIPENLFVAVAQVLAYIYQLRQAAAGSRVIPHPPTNIKVPDEYTRKEQP
jgi:flagellar biosynthetic protein FlhB